jgi:hypothetical protein
MTVHKKNGQKGKTFFDAKIKTSHVLKFKTVNLSYRNYSQQHSIPSSSLSDWVKEYDACLANDRVPFQHSVGKPSFLGEKEVSELVEITKKAKKTQKSLKKSQLLPVVIDLNLKKQIRCGKAPRKKCPSEKTLKRLRCYLKSRLRKPQHKTNARILAESDPRHVLSFYCMSKAYSERNTFLIGMPLNLKFRKTKMKRLLLLLNPKTTIFHPL